MIGYLEYLKIPANIGIIFVIAFFVMQIIGEVIEAKGKIVPEFMKIRKFFKRKRLEKQTLKSLPETLQNFQIILNDFSSHYSTDNIEKRNKWINHINEKECTYDKELAKLTSMLDKVNQTVIDIQIDNKRSQIIDFASMVSDETIPVTREQFNRILKMYDAYEKILEENGLTNGEIDIAHSIIVKAYKKHMEYHTFVEDYQE